MINFVKKLFQDEEKEINVLKEQVEKLQRSLEAMQEKQTNEVPNQEQQAESSNTPLVQIRGDKIDVNNGILIDLEWNDDFIRYLKENGVGGSSDEERVKNWLVRLYSHLASRLEEKEMEKQDSAQSNTSDFT